MAVKRHRAGSPLGGRFARKPSPKEINTAALTLNIDSYRDELGPVLAKHPRRHEAAFMDATIKMWGAYGEEDKLERLHHKARGTDTGIASQYAEAQALAKERTSAWIAALGSYVDTETTKYNRGDQEARHMANALLRTTATATSPLSEEGYAGANRPTRKGRKATKEFESGLSEMKRRRPESLPER